MKEFTMITWESLKTLEADGGAIEVGDDVKQMADDGSDEAMRKMALLALASSMDRLTLQFFLGLEIADRITTVAIAEQLDIYTSDWDMETLNSKVAEVSVSRLISILMKG